MRLADFVRRCALALAVVVFLSVAVTGSAAAESAPEPAPTAEQKKEAATKAAERFCNDGLLGTVMKLPVVKRRCAGGVANLLQKQGRGVTTSILCQAIASPAGIAKGGVSRACRALGKPILNKLFNFYGDALKAATSIVGGVVTVAKFVANPLSALDNFANTLKENATGLVATVLPELSKATAFDASAGWWLRHYAAAAGLGLLVMALMLIITTVQTARNALSGDDLQEAIFQHLPTGLMLMVFGPAIGAIAVNATNELTDGIISFIAPDLGSFLGKLTVFSTLSSSIPGGVAVGLILYLMLLIGTLGIFVGLLLQTLALYFTGVACAIAFGMWVNPRWRRKAMRIPYTWLGILLAKPLLFLLLGVAFGLADYATSATNIADPGLKSLTTALMAALALLVAGLAPFTLLKYAPLLPDGSDSVGGTGRGTFGSAVVSTAGSATTSIAMKRASSNSERASHQGAAGGSAGTPAGEGVSTSGEGSSSPLPTSAGTSPAAFRGRSTGPTKTASAGSAGSASAPAVRPLPASGGMAGSGGAAAGTAGAGAAGAATGGAALAVAAGLEFGKAGMQKAKNVAENAAPDIPSVQDGD